MKTKDKAVIATALLGSFCVMAIAAYKVFKPKDITKTQDWLFLDEAFWYDDVTKDWPI